MKIGLFDHVEFGDRPLAQLFDERLRFAQAADAAGFYCLQIAEHHATPLNMVPVPGVYLGALAQATKRIRLGPLVYLLTLYSPLRLAEEICMLDHLSHGRIDVGVGRGVSPYELKYHKVDHGQSREIFFDAFDCLSAALTAETLTYKGEHYTYENVPIALHPLQAPHPPFWYASSNETGSAWGGEQGLHYVTLGPMQLAKTNIAAYKKALAQRGAPVQPKPEFAGGAAIGVQRHIFVADTDAEARRFGKPAMDRHLDHINWLRSKHGQTGLTSASECGARSELRRLPRRRHRHRRLAGDRARRTREAGQGIGHQLSADLPLPRRHGVCRRDAVARAVSRRGHAASGEAVDGVKLAALAAL